MTQNLDVLLYMEYGKSRNPDGRPSSWNHGKTKTIRVPVSLAERVERYARVHDGVEIQDMTHNLNDSDLSEVVALLRDAISFPANTGGKIKKNIRIALAILERSSKTPV